MRFGIVVPALFITALSLGGCGRISSLTSGASGPFSGGGGLRGSANEIDGTRFRTRVDSNRDDPRAFFTSTRGAGRDISGAMEAGRVEAVRHCLTRFGGSEIVWAQGPDRPVEQIALDPSGVLVLSGRCVTR